MIAACAGIKLQPPDTLRADPGGPYVAERGETVTLDGTRSRPSKARQIQYYRWKLTPTGCPDLGRTAEVSGSHVTYTALCTVTAQLTVNDGAKTDTRSVEVIVKKRPWKSSLTTITPVQLRNMPFDSGYFGFGLNRCERHPDSDPNHIYHPRAGSMIDYEQGTFWLNTVTDTGPFAGVWFAEKVDFDIRRVIICNQKLYPGGSVYAVNAAKGRAQKAQIDRLRRSVEVHEKLHSALLKGALSLSDDAVKIIERGMAEDRGTLEDQINSILRNLHTLLMEATAEDKVRAQMRRIPEFRAGGRIYYPASASTQEGYRDFPSFAELGDSPGGGNTPP